MVTYDLITPENKEKLTPELIEELSRVTLNSVEGFTNLHMSLLRSYYNTLKTSKKINFRIFMTYKNEKMIGFLTFRHNHNNRNEFEISHFFVDKKLTTTTDKIGTKLMIKALSHLIHKDKINTLSPGLAVDGKVHTLINKMFERINKNNSYKKYSLESKSLGQGNLEYIKNGEIISVHKNKIKINRK